MLIARLAAVNYYRLSGYWHPFRDAVGDGFRPNTKFDDVWARYAFDRHLRLLVMDAVERIEVAVRSQLAYHLAQQTGDPFAYATDPKSLPGLSQGERSRFLEELQDEVSHSKETFAEHFRTTYGSEHPHMPVWMACELMTFGCMLTLYRGCHPDARKKVAVAFAVHDTVLGSWLLALNTVRNVCAHHARLWNRELGTKPMIPKKDPAWHKPVNIANDRMFGILSICKHCLDRVAPQTRWATRLRDLLRAYPYVPRASMGMPSNWEESPIWAFSQALAAPPPPAAMPPPTHATSQSLPASPAPAGPATAPTTPSADPSA